MFCVLTILVKGKTYKQKAKGLFVNFISNVTFKFRIHKKHVFLVELHYFKSWHFIFLFSYMIPLNISWKSTKIWKIKHLFFLFNLLDRLTIPLEMMYAPFSTSVLSYMFLSCLGGWKIKAHNLIVVLAAVDLVLIMSVNPGFGGQSFIESQVKKISDLRRLCAEKVCCNHLCVCVDYWVLCFSPSFYFLHNL